MKLCKKFFMLRNYVYGFQLLMKFNIIEFYHHDEGVIVEWI